MIFPNQILINGMWRDGSDGTKAPVINPATEEAFAEVCWGTPADADLALDAAEKAIADGATLLVDGGMRADSLRPGDLVLATVIGSEGVDLVAAVDRRLR